MQTKTYFASSVPAALEVARKELGSEAMLLNSKPAPAESRAFGRLEVTFAFEPRKTEAPASWPDVRYETTPDPRFEAWGEGRSDPTPEARPARQSPRPGAFSASDVVRPSRSSRMESADLDDLRRQVEALRVAVGGQADYAPLMPAAPIRNTLQGVWGREPDNPGISRLQRNGISDTLARDLTDAAAKRGGDTISNLVAEISGRIPSSSFGEWQAGETRMMAFVGPTGRGKTTSLVKIAVKFGIGRSVPVRIYQVGGHGVGCQEQLARYAAILGVPFFASESLASLNLSLAGDGWKGLVLLDTPGISPAATGDIQELGQFFARRPEIERHLVLRADTRTADMSYMVSRFSAMGSLRLLFTSTEETLTTGSMVETMISTGLGATFMGTGQDIPDDVEEVDVPKLARSVCGERAMTAGAAG